MKNAQKTYLEREALTATPQKLQLLLIEAAIKNLHRTKMHWENRALDQAFLTLSRAQDIVAEILSSLDMEGAPEIAKSLASIYVFIFRKIAATSGPNDVATIDEAIKVLMTERDCWKEICEKFGSKSDVNQNSASFELKKTQEIKPASPHIGTNHQQTPKTEKATTVNQGFSWNA